MESQIATNVVDLLRFEFSAALLDKYQEIAALRSEGTSTARTNTESSSNVQLVAQLAEQATMIKKSNDQYFSLKSRLDFYARDKQVWNIVLLSLPPKLFSQYPLLKLYLGQLKLLPSLSKRLIQCLPRLSQ